jgi:hypothetical protein
MGTVPPTSQQRYQPPALIVVSKLKCPVLLASEMSGFGFLVFI